MCSNRWKNHDGNRSVKQTLSLTRGVVVALVSRQRDRDDKFRVRGAASALALLYVLQYSDASLHDQRRRDDFISSVNAEGGVTSIRLRDKFAHHYHHLSRDRGSGRSMLKTKHESPAIFDCD